jgi:hypothetical protein
MLCNVLTIRTSILTIISHFEMQTFTINQTIEYVSSLNITIDPFTSFSQSNECRGISPPITGGYVKRREI